MGFSRPQDHVNALSGESEALIVVLTASPELSLVEEHLLNGELPISSCSALGNAIYGKTSGSEFKLRDRERHGSGAPLKIEVAARLRDYGRRISAVGI